MQQPKLNFADVKFADAPATFKRAQASLHTPLVHCRHRKKMCCLSLERG